MAHNQALTRLVDRHSIEILVETLFREGFSRNDIVQAIVGDIPTDLDILNEVLDAIANPDERDSAARIN